MTGLSLALLVACTACVLAIPSSLLSDVKQAEMTHARLTNKVKRAQEVIMFGNQQNRGGDGRNGFSLQRTEKRGVDVEDNVLADSATEQPRVLYPAGSEEVLEEPKVMAMYDTNFRQNLGEAEYPTRLQNAVLKSEYFTDPGNTN